MGGLQPWHWLIVIAVFYTEELQVAYLMYGSAALLGLIGLNRLGVRSPGSEKSEYRQGYDAHGVLLLC